MPMTVIVTRDVPMRTRGFLSSVAPEPAPGFYTAGHMTKGVRERVWSVVSDWHPATGEGSIVMVWRDDTALDDRYEQSPFAKFTQVGPDPLVQDPRTFDAELTSVIGLTRQMHLDPDPSCIVDGDAAYDIVHKYHNLFLSQTYWPAITAARLWRLGRPSDALFVARLIHASDWRAACVEWIERRLARLSAAEAAE